MFEIESDPSIVELDRYVPEAPATVWRALTEPASVEQWLVRSVGLRPEIGTTFILEIPSDPPGEVSCEVIDAVPAVRFAHSYTDLRAPRPARWVVDRKLVPEGRGTRIVFTMSGFDVDDRQQKFARNAAERGYRNTLIPKLAAAAAAIAD
ncbi:ATPase [Tsukamurella pulmonis]|uniref:SRPBCC family protein n=1 Tax=Tsukamurella pulmonis TaxID=47312 RepID=UPI00079A3B22|nr:SRPBCC domain-containing protein [Tsukamurella pulmonis]KXP08069.1 ATPase [Tsukamurella pulmonis]RDH12055.1 SRPBCC domain-containing protein [Tsukamurella pulmonis]